MGSLPSPGHLKKSQQWLLWTLISQTILETWAIYLDMVCVHCNSPNPVTITCCLPLREQLVKVFWTCFHFTHYDGKALSFNQGLQYPHLQGPVHTPDNNRWDTPCIKEGLACWLTLCILEKIICNLTNSVQISFIQTLKFIGVFSGTIWWC